MILDINPGTEVSYNNRIYVVTKLLDFKKILAQDIETKETVKLPIVDIKGVSDLNKRKSDIHVDLLTDKEFSIAQDRFRIIQSLLDNPNRGIDIRKVSKEEKIHISTLYRWIERYETTGTISSLAPKEKTGGKGRSRLDPEIVEIINSLIESEYLNSQKKSIQQVHRKISLACRKANLNIPHINTIRKFVQNIDAKYRVKKREGSKQARTEFGEKPGTYDEAKYPYSIIQIDHTLFDIILVDSLTRQPIGRPWITVAIDIYSRMITGYYISFDPPSSMNVGLCLANSILSKENHLVKHEIDGEWPCWGIMNKVHTDNALEFKGNMLKRSCAEYNIDIQWRPVGKPEYGGHIERLIGTLSNEVHALPGTTFSKVSYRENYNSEKKAVFSLEEFDKWFTTYIVGVYHNKLHSSLNMSPLQKYQEGIFGSNTSIGRGLPSKIENEEKLRKDFMPFFERTIQNYGISIDKINYYHDILRRWINYVDPKTKTKKKFIFRRDPRDISIVYFLDPELRKYFPIPYSNISKPPMSIWEYKEAMNLLKARGEKNIDEDKIFDAYEQMNEIESQAKSTTRIKKRTTKEGRRNIHNLDEPKSPNISEDLNIDEITPFTDIDHEAL